MQQQQQMPEMPLTGLKEAKFASWERLFFVSLFDVSKVAIGR
jgi:hypothetical protein